VRRRIVQNMLVLGTSDFLIVCGWIMRPRRAQSPMGRRPSFATEYRAPIRFIHVSRLEPNKRTTSRRQHRTSVHPGACEMFASFPRIFRTNEWHF
jgi:hypothetical protein